MLKSLNKNDVLVTPYSAVKEHHLSNIDNTDLILFEHTGSDGGPLAVAIEYIDYGDGSGAHPVINSSCSLANEQQTLDKANYREGLKTSGHFYDTEAQNRDGTYKRMVYDQTQNMFYNNYRDPTKMWGMEEIDFDKSQTKKFLQDKFVMLDIPTVVIGEKIQPNTVYIDDQTSDDKYIITDDGHCNLFIGSNLFSKHQELGDFTNDLLEGHVSTCDNYFSLDIPNGLINLTASQLGISQTASLHWFYDKSDADGFIFHRSIDSGSTWAYLLTVADGTLRDTYDVDVVYGGTYWYKTYPYNIFGSGSWSNTASVYINSLLIVRNPQDTAGDISSSVSFSVYAGGVEPISYQWQSGSTILSDTVQITGSTTSSVLTASLHVNRILLPNSGAYRVFVWNSYQGLTSSYADLHVNLYPPTVSAPVDVFVNLSEGLPLITSHPADQFTSLGGTASFTVSASGTEPLYYFWQSGSTWLTDTSRISGSQSSSIRISNVQETDTGSYRVLVSNDVGYVYSNTASLIINQGDLITTTGTPYRMGPFDTFEDYPAGTEPAAGGYGWDGAWQLRAIGTPDYNVIVAMDNTDDYSPWTGMTLTGYSTGSGWASAWKS